MVDPRRQRPQQRQQLRVRRRDVVLRTPPVILSSANVLEAKGASSPRSLAYLALPAQHRFHDLPRHLPRLQAGRHPAWQHPRHEAFEHARPDVPRAQHRRAHARRVVDVAQLERETLVEGQGGGLAGRVCEASKRGGSALAARRVGSELGLVCSQETPKGLWT